MSRFGSTDYDATGGGGSSGGQDYKDRETILMGSYAIVEATLDTVGVFDGQYGLNIIPGLDDAEVIEGVVTSRVEDKNGEADNKVRVFGWDHWFDRDENMDLEPMVEGGEISTDELGRRVTMEAGGDKYKYQIDEGVLEGRDEPVSIGDVELWLGNGKKARTLAKVLSERGPEIIGDDEDDHAWLDAEDRREFNLRDELQGRRIMFWFEQVTLTPEDIDDLDETITYTDAVVLDAETEAPITIMNDEEDEDSFESDSSDSDDEDDSDNMEGSESGDVDEQELPEDIEELVDMFARTGQSDRDQISNIVNDEAPDGYEPDMEFIMAEI